MRAASEPDHEAEAGGEAELNHGYVFLVRWKRRRAILDSFLDVSEYIGATGRHLNAVSKLLDRPMERLDLVARSIRGMSLRQQFNSDIEGPLLIRTEIPRSAENIEQYLGSLSDEELDDFIRSARWNK